MVMKTFHWKPPQEVSAVPQPRTVLQHQNHSRRFRVEICQAAAVRQENESR